MKDKGGFWKYVSAVALCTIFVVYLVGGVIYHAGEMNAIQNAKIELRDTKIIVIELRGKEYIHLIE